MNFLDRLIGFFSPRWGLERITIREALRTYDAAAQDRLQSRRALKNISPEEAVRMSREKVLALSRDLDRNNGWVCGLYNSIVANVVGEGIVPEARIRRPRAGDLVTDANDLIEEEWKAWGDRADMSGRQSIYEIQAAVDRDLWAAGEILATTKVLTGTAARNRRIPVAIDLIEAEQLAGLDDELEGGRRIVQGVEMDSDGRVLAYHIYPNHPSEGLSLQQTKRIPAEKVLHLYRAQRAKSPRGVPRIAPVARAFAALAQYLDFELTRARVGSAWAFLWKRTGKMKLPGIKPTGETDSSDNPLLNLDGGTILVGGPDDDLKSGGPTWANTAFEAFVNLLLHHCAAGMNVSYELLARDFTKGNFSATRQGCLEDRKQWRPEQKFIIRRFNVPVFNEVATVGGLLGIQPFSTFVPERIPLGWRTSGWDWIDPVKEVESEKTAVGCGFKSPQQIAAERGADFYEVIDEIAEAQRYAEERGVDLSMWQDPSSSNDTGANDDEDEGTSGKETSKKSPRGHLAVVPKD